MGNGTDFVTWPVFKEHEEKAEQGFDRLAALEEEVNGSERTGRLSLRQEFVQEITKTRRWIIGLIVAGLLSQAIRWGWDFFHHTN